MSSGHYVDHLEKALAETTKAHTELAQKLAMAIGELERCHIDLFEAEDKFHVLSFYIKDGQALECAKSRVTWMCDAGQRVKSTIEAIKATV